jgi:hypothetical protein
MAVVRAQSAARWCGPGVAAHVDEKASATELAATSMAGRNVRLGSEASTRRGMEKRERERERERGGWGWRPREKRGSCPTVCATWAHASRRRPVQHRWLFHGDDGLTCGSLTQVKESEGK